jgi:hypothetical protein
MTHSWQYINLAEPSKDDSGSRRAVFANDRDGDGKLQNLSAVHMYFILYIRVWAMELFETRAKFYNAETIPTGSSHFSGISWIIMQEIKDLI